MAFYNALVHGDYPQVAVLREMVTPESLAFWGDFSAVREGLFTMAPTTRAERPAPGVAYVKFTADHGQVVAAPGPVVVMVETMTLQFRPERDRWLVHAIGTPWPPEELPHLAPGS